MSGVPAHDPASGLPLGFEDLEPLVAEWALPTEGERATRRCSVTIGALQALHAQVFPRLDAIVARLNTLPNDVAALDPRERNLFHLALMTMEAAGPIDLEWKSPDIEDVFPIGRMRFDEPY
jgi:hypothetical protein